MSRLHSQLFFAGLLALTVAGCGGGESAGHTDDKTPGGTPSAAIPETMDPNKMDEVMNQAADSARKTGK